MIVKLKIVLSLSLISLLSYGLYSDKVTCLSMAMGVTLLIVIWIDDL